MAKKIQSELTFEGETRLVYPGPDKELLERLRKRIEELEARFKPANYRILSSRWDVSEHVIAEFTAESEEKAKETFEDYKAKRKYRWDYLKLIRFTEEIIEMSDPDNRG